MSHFFNLVGHIVPNADSELHLEACEMREIWKEYKDDMVAYFGESEENCLRYSAFLRLWSIAFSHVKVREYKQVAGKCGTCAKLSAMRRRRKDYYGRKLYTELQALHRSMYTAERQAYYDRRCYAILHPDTCMSINTDGMNQNHSRIPYLGNLQEFSRPLKQHIQGVLEHGEEFVMYRSFNNVRHDTNLAIHCLLMQLEQRMTRSKDGITAKKKANVYYYFIV